MLVLQFPLLIVAKVRMELWPSQFFFMGSKDKWWADKVRVGETSQTHANEAMTKMRAEAAEAKVVLIEWNTPESISPDTKEAIGK